MKLLHKHIFREFAAKKTMMGLLSLVLIFDSFLYFFVRFSVDKNLDIYRNVGKESLSENGYKYLIALENNKILIRNMSGAMTFVFAIILFLFIFNIMKHNQIKIGNLQSLGFMTKDYAIGCSKVLMCMALPSTIIGFVIGFFCSDILILANQKTYGVTDLSKGIHITTFLKGTVLLTLLVGAVTFVACIAFKSRDTALLIKGDDGGASKPGIVERFIGVFHFENAYKYKLTFRNISGFILILTAISTFSIMFMLSMSLTGSSKRLVESQLEGRNYLYETSYDDYRKDIISEDIEADYLLKAPVMIEMSGDDVEYNLIGVDGDGKLFSLMDQDGDKIDEPALNGIVINPELAENYGVTVGETITVTIGSEIADFIVEDIADNAEIKCMYISKKELSSLLGVEPECYNFVYTCNPLEAGKSVPRSEIIKKLEDDQTSNKASAIINQSIGVATGVLLICLAFFIGLSGNINNVLIFDLLGYDKKKIGQILLDPYIVAGNAIYVLTIPVCLFFARKIQITTSLATGDYMPFVNSGVTYVYMFVIMNLILFLVRALFSLKINKIISGEKQSEYLYEW